MKITLIHEAAKLPTRKTAGSVGYDLHAIMPMTIRAHSRAIIPIGIVIEFIYPYYGIIKSRSGLSARHGLEVGAGVIDMDYRGEINVLLYNHSDYDYEILKGERIAQLIIQKYESVEFETSEMLSETDRGANGFGSTGRI